jgi:AraC-like DNA-binding protein
MSFDHLAGQRLIEQLPELLVIDSFDGDSNGWLQSSLQFISQEAHVLKPGGETIITHLADILVIQAIRTWVNRAPEASTGWLAALRDKKIGQALAAIHRDPEQEWTIESLARVVGMSRSGFSAKFTELVGDSAKSYLTKWRMQIARQRLVASTTPVAIIAEQLGYNSEAAFCRAFKRNIGVTPGSIRRQ